jgi:UDP-N-acetylmuramyl pentapeptide phosphotransferase/UDP-N-acetylglucosamine-1-phosphate transferase
MVLDSVILISIPLIILINFFLVKNYNFFFLKKTKDNKFSKPQAFHLKSIPRMGGFLIYIFITIFLIIFYQKVYFFYSILFLGSFFFILGFIEDLNISIKPQFRLFLMFLSTFFLIYFLDIKIFNTQLSILNNLINNNKIISSLFVCLCLLFIINGCNFIDGFNGLLIIHSIIILGILYFINFQNSNVDYLRYFILFLIITCFSVLFYNFPKAKIFLGDGGAYFLGSIMSLITIELSNLNKIISPFFFACLLFYIFFEVFFSFFRKIFFYKSSPLKPDKQHLHMLLFKFIFHNIKNFEKANYITGLLVNIFYLFLMLPLLFYYKDKIFCEIYFLILLIIYLLGYLYFNNKINKYSK